MSASGLPRSFVRVLSPALRQAAAVAAVLDGRVMNRPKSGEVTEVKAALTVADTAAQEALLVPLLQGFGHVQLDAEEDTPTAKRFSGQSGALVVVDPIDGTLNFYLNFGGPYAVMIGLAVAGRFEASLLALPREGLFFEAVRGGGAWVAQGEGRHGPARCGGEAAPPEGRAGASSGRVLLSHGMPESVQDALRRRGYEIGFGCGGAVAVAPLIPGVRAGLRLVSTPSPGLSRRGRIGALIAREAGALVCNEEGEPFTEALDEPARALLVACGAQDLSALRDALATLDA